MELILISKASIFLPRYSGVRPDHQARDKYAHDGENEHGVQAGADTTKHHLTQLHLEQRHKSPQRVYESCIELTAPVDVAVVRSANSADAPIPKRDSLPSMLPPGCRALTAWSTPNFAIRGLPCCSL